jgi:hypothetical protein
MSIRDVTQSVIAVLVVAAALYSAIMNLPGTQYLTPVAGVIIGFYFKEGVSALGKALGK